MWGPGLEPLQGQPDGQVNLSSMAMKPKVKHPPPQISFSSSIK